MACAMPMTGQASAERLPAGEIARLVREARAGDREAFGRLVELHQRAATRLAYRLLADPDEADGAVQDAFIKAWGSLAEFRDECPFGAWLARIVLNRCRDRLKGRRWVVTERRLRTGADGTASPLDTAVDPAPGPETRAAGREIGRKIVELSRELPRMQREVFTLRYYDERSLAEIAALFGVDVGTVKTHLFRAAKRMRASLEALYGQRLPV
jgi:RNA polymerase sigma-70 factor (ECF subfamily)